MDLQHLHCKTIILQIHDVGVFVNGQVFMGSIGKRKGAIFKDPNHQLFIAVMSKLHQSAGTIIIGSSRRI